MCGEESSNGDRGIALPIVEPEETVPMPGHPPVPDQNLAHVGGFVWSLTKQK